jgi:hypothetical protein
MLYAYGTRGVAGGVWCYIVTTLASGQCGYPRHRHTQPCIQAGAVQRRSAALCCRVSIPAQSAGARPQAIGSKEASVPVARSVQLPPAHRQVVTGAGGCRRGRLQTTGLAFTPQPRRWKRPRASVLPAAGVSHTVPYHSVLHHTTPYLTINHHLPIAYAIRIRYTTGQDGGGGTRLMPGVAP